MKHELPSANWATALADRLKKAQDGDVIVVATQQAQELAERAHQRMCPQKTIAFEIREAK